MARFLVGPSEEPELEEAPLPEHRAIRGVGAGGGSSAGCEREEEVREERLSKSIQYFYSENARGNRNSMELQCCTKRALTMVVLEGRLTSGMIKVWGVG